MKHSNYVLFVCMILLFSLSSCELIGDIFQAGVWVGIMIVVGVILLILWLVSRFRK